MKKIPFHIVSGFLGSGKTTFLKRIIEKYSGQAKLGIIQNEFAPANVDGVELKKSGSNFELLEINNGSVFCVCLMGDFVRSLEKFIDEHQPEMLVIEASGLSDTTSIAEVISAGKLAEKIYLASNWCIVDAPNFAKVGLMKERVTHQLRMADVVLINKTDLAENDTTAIREEINKINPFADIRRTSFCDIDFNLKNKPATKFYMDELKALPRPDIHSMVIKSGRKFTREKLVKFLNDWAHKSYRIKGYINLKEGKTVAVQCAFSQIETSETKDIYGPSEIIALTDQFTLREWNKAFKSYSQ